MDASNCYRDSVPVSLVIADLPQGVSNRDLVIPPEDAAGICGDGELSGPLRISLKLWRDSGALVVEGQAACSLRFACARCLEKFTADISFPVELSYMFRDEPTVVDPWEDGDALREITPDTMEINLGPDIFDGLVLTLPIKPLCRDDCRGLCPKCYTNLNQGQCSCRVEPVDPRWDELKQLREEMGPQ
jgi:uncharacterized protein